MRRKRLGDCHGTTLSRNPPRGWKFQIHVPDANGSHWEAEISIATDMPDVVRRSSAIDCDGHFLAIGKRALHLLHQTVLLCEICCSSIGHGRIIILHMVN